MIPEVHACSGYLVITAPNGAYRDNAGALPLTVSLPNSASSPRTPVRSDATA
jgi:hypothetical protein